MSSFRKREQRKMMVMKVLKLSQNGRTPVLIEMPSTRVENRLRHNIVIR